MLARPAVVAFIASDVNARPMGRDKNRSDRSELITKLAEKSSDWMDTDGDSSSVERVASEPVLEVPVNLSKSFQCNGGRT